MHEAGVCGRLPGLERLQDALMMGNNTDTAHRQTVGLPCLDLDCMLVDLLDRLLSLGAEILCNT